MGITTQCRISAIMLNEYSWFKPNMDSCVTQVNHKTEHVTKYCLEKYQN